MEPHLESMPTADGTRDIPLSVRELLDANALARGLAIWTVVACHVPFAHAYWRPLAAFASAGKLAVSVFLFLSGMMLQAQVNRAGGTLPLMAWAKKRFLRIYPVYRAGLAFTLLGAWFLRGKIFDLGTIAANALSITVWLGRDIVSCGYAKPFWFISLLLLCYALFPLVCRIRRKSGLVLGALALSGLALWQGRVMGAAAFAFPSFFMGMALADAVQRNGQTVPAAKLQAALFPLLLALLALVFKGPRFFSLNDRHAVWIDLLGCAGLTVAPWPALCAVAYFQRALARRVPALLRGALWISGLSFAVYCVHEPLLRIVERSTAAGHPWSGLLGYVLATLGAGWALDALDRRIRGGR